MEAVTSTRFQHEGLAAPERQIRLLRIVSGPQDHDVTCRLETVDATAAPPYNAVSYTWGDASHKVPFHILAHFQSVASFELAGTPGELGSMFEILRFLQDSSLCRGGTRARAYLTWETALHFFPFRGCAEPRDRLYGLTKLVNADGLPPLPTDYGVGIVQVAMNYLACYEAEQEKGCYRHYDVLLTVTLLLEALQLSPRDPAIAELIQSRRRRKSTAAANRPLQHPGGSSSASPPETTGLVVRDGHRFRAASLLYEDGDGNLVMAQAALVPSCASCRAKGAPLPPLLRRRSVRDIYMAPPPPNNDGHAHHDDGDDGKRSSQGVAAAAAAYAFCACQPGDYLVPLRFWNVYRAMGLVPGEPARPDAGKPVLCLVLRPSSPIAAAGPPAERRHDAVGLALARPALFVELSQDPGRPACGACRASKAAFNARVVANKEEAGDATPLPVFRLFFSAEDLLVLATLMLLLRAGPGEEEEEDGLLVEEMAKTPPVVGLTSYAVLQSELAERDRELLQHW